MKDNQTITAEDHVKDPETEKEKLTAIPMTKVEVDDFNH